MSKMNASEAIQRVLAVYPDAKCWAGHGDDPYLVVWSGMKYHSVRLSFNSTKDYEAAWIDAASRLPATVEPAAGDGEKCGTCGRYMCVCAVAKFLQHKCRHCGKEESAHHGVASWCYMNPITEPSDRETRFEPSHEKEPAKPESGDGLLKPLNRYRFLDGHDRYQEACLDSSVSALESKYKSALEENERLRGLLREWIPVEVKPYPDHGGQVLVSFMVGGSGPFTYSARHESYGWDWGNATANKNRRDSDVIAWMEHPVPYKAAVTGAKL